MGKKPGRKPGEDPRNVSICLKISRAELEELNRQVCAAGVSRSEFIREKLLPCVSKE